MLTFYLIAVIRGFGKYYLGLSGSEQFWWATEFESVWFYTWKKQLLNSRIDKVIRVPQAGKLSQCLLNIFLSSLFPDQILIPHRTLTPPSNWGWGEGVKRVGDFVLCLIIFVIRCAWTYIFMALKRLSWLYLCTFSSLLSTPVGF